MPEVAIVDNQLLTALIDRIEDMGRHVDNITAELRNTKKPYLSANELMELTGFSSKWVIDNKESIGFTTIGNQLRFKRKDVEAFFEKNYIKPKK